MFGRQFCKVWISFDVMFCTASIVTLCFISLDRYCSVVTPYYYPKRMSRKRYLHNIVSFDVYRQRPGAFIRDCCIEEDVEMELRKANQPIESVLPFKKILADLIILKSTFLPFPYNPGLEPEGFTRCIIMAVTIWVYSSLISFLPVMQGWNEIPGVNFDAGTECVFVTNWAFAIVASALAFYIPFLIMCSMYFFIYRASRLKSSRIMAQTLDLHYHPNSKRPNNLQLENKATQTMSIIISVFVMCWLPYFVFNVWLAVHGAESTSDVITHVFKVITWLGYCNSTINPMLYAFLNRDFQRALKKLLICRRWRTQVDIGEDMVSIVTFSKTAQDAEYNTR
eukprot:g39927.t1